MTRPLRSCVASWWRALLVLSALACPARAAGEPPLAALTLVGPTQIMFKAGRDACDGVDVPDASVRAFRDRSGTIVLFGMHYRNRAFRGPDLDRLKLDCAVVLDSAGNSDPARFDDRSWITATWTDDGTRVAGLIHHEFQANEHPGRCRLQAYLPCWYNSVVAASSMDGGRSFIRAEPPIVVAAAPFPQDVGQGRHRGFFNPSNIFADGRWRYFFASTTGWSESGRRQDAGVCLFRSDDPGDPTRWRAWTGSGFAAAFPGPYGRTRPGNDACKPIAPFPTPVGAVVRHRGTGAWIAMFMAKAGPGFAEAGFYWTTSRDLVAWDQPRLLVAGATLYDDPCASPGELIAYPSLLDPAAAGRNFDDVGDAAILTYVTLRTEGCTITSDRDLLRRPVAIKVRP